MIEGRRYPCPNCGYKVLAGAVFCINCAARLPSTPPTQTPSESSRPAAEQADSESRHQRPEPSTEGEPEPATPSAPVAQPASEQELLNQAGRNFIPTTPIGQRQGEMASPAASPARVDSASRPAGGTRDRPNFDMIFMRAAQVNRWWAIPVVGFVAKMIVLLPHVLLLAFIGLAVALLQLVLWIPVLFGAKYPRGAFFFVGGWLAWSLRVSSFVYGLTDRYPPFSFDGLREDETAYPVTITLARQPGYRRRYGIPLLGYLVKVIMLIPHVFVLYVLGIIVGLLQLVTWLPVLFKGRYPDWGYQVVGGYLRWTGRIYAYLLGLTDRYPPFELSEGMRVAESGELAAV